MTREEAVSIYKLNHAGELRECAQCKELKVLVSEFRVMCKSTRKNRRMPKPLPLKKPEVTTLSTCKVCNNATIRAQLRLRRQTDPVYKAKVEQRFRKLEAWKKFNPEVQRRSVARWREKNRHKHLAQLIAVWAHPDPQSCSIAGCNRPAERHHPDYNKPTEIIWLCRRHHKEEHVSAKSMDRSFENPRPSTVPEV